MAGTHVELAGLEYHEAVIERGLATFIDVGQSLLAIRDGRLYRESHSTFEDYCRERWGWSRTHANRLIGGAEVAATLAPIGAITQPTAESQVRPLVQLSADQQAEVWREAVDDAGGRVPTAAQVQAAVDRVRPDAALRMSNSNEWYTPAKYIEAARLLMGSIDLDPATSVEANKRVRAAEIFTEADNGLAQRWDGRVWLNPPYGGLSGPFTAKLIQEYIADRVTEAVLLVNANSTDTAWFQPLWGYVLCFTDHRINFDSPTGAASGSTHGSVFAYLGANQEGFYEMFSQFGVVVQRYQL